MTVIPVTARVPRPVVRWVLALILAALAAALAAVAVKQPFPSPAWGGAALAAWCAALLVACAASIGRAGTGLGEWKIGAWMLVWMALTCGLATIAAAPAGSTAAMATPSGLTAAEWLTGAAATAWAAAYCAAPRHLAVPALRAALRHRAPVTRGPLTPWLLYATGTAAQLATAVLTGHFGYTGTVSVTSATWYQQMLGDAAYCCPLGTATAALRVFSGNGSRLTLGILAAAECATAAVSGFRGAFVSAGLAIAIPAACYGRKLPRPLIAAALIGMLLLVIPFTAAYRAQVRTTSAVLSPSQAAVIVPSTAARVLADASPSSSVTGVSYLAQRFREISAAAVVVQDTPSAVPYASPLKIPETVAAGLIPRVLWPGKPILDPGYQFAEEYYGQPSGEMNAAATTPVADLYRYGGLVPVLVGMALLGLLMGVLDGALDVRDPRCVLLIFLLWPVLAVPEGSYTAILTSLLGLIVTWLAVATVAFRRVPFSTVEPLTE
jgi:hypothetical protein